MASPTTNKGYQYPAHGGAVNSWDTPLNGDLELADLNLGGTYLVTLGSSIGVTTFGSTGVTAPSTVGSLTLPSSLAANLNYQITGTIGANLNLVYPAAGGIYDVTNNSSGAFSVTVITAAVGSSGVAIGQGGSAAIVADGTNVNYATTDARRIYTFAGNPNGSVAGVAGNISGSFSDLVWDSVDQQLFVATTTGSTATTVWQQPGTTIARGFDSAINLSLSIVHTGGNLLQVNVKTSTGATPTTGSPVICEFQTLSGAATTGAPTSVSITSALSMDSNAIGASLGSTNNVPFRLWIALFNNAGTAVLALMNASTSTSIRSISEYSVASTVSISGASTSAGVWYTPNGTTLTNCAYRLIGYCEYTSGLATAGTYTSDPSNVVLFGPGIKKPGDVVQMVRTAFPNPATGSLAMPFDNSIPQITEGDQYMTQAITPSSVVSLLKIETVGYFSNNNVNAQVMALFQDATPNALTACCNEIAFTNALTLEKLCWLMQAGTTSTTTFKVRAGMAFSGGGAVMSFNGIGGAGEFGGVQNSYIEVIEYMG